MGCSREVAGGTHSTKCSSQCKLPIGGWARGSPHSWARRVAHCPRREHTSSPRCATRLKINTAFAITCELRALFTGADFHFTWSVPAYPYCSGWTAKALRPMVGGRDAGQKISYKRIQKSPFSPSPFLTLSAFSAQDANLHGLLSTSSRRLEEWRLPHCMEVRPLCNSKSSIQSTSRFFPCSAPSANHTRLPHRE